MLTGQLPHKFWAKALSTAVFLSNQSFTSAVPGMTLLQAWSGKKPSVSNLRVFGCTAITWQSKKQLCVALSTAEAEYLVLPGVAQKQFG